MFSEQQNMYLVNSSTHYPTSQHKNLKRKQQEGTIWYQKGQKTKKNTVVTFRSQFNHLSSPRVTFLINFVVNKLHDFLPSINFAFIQCFLLNFSFSFFVVFKTSTSFFFSKRYAKYIIFSLLTNNSGKRKYVKRFFNSSALSSCDFFQFLYYYILFTLPLSGFHAKWHHFNSM